MSKRAATEHLGEIAFLRLLIGAPAQEFSAMAEATAGEVIVAHLANQLRLEGLPFHGAFGAPAAEPARSLAGKAGGCDQGLDNSLQFMPLLGGEAGSKSHVIEQPLVVIGAGPRR